MEAIIGRRREGHSGDRERDEHRINRQIRAPRVRVIDADGEQLGVMNPEEAREHAEEAGLDLVEVAPQADPPVCRIMDYGKFRYKQSKRQVRQQHVQLKTIKLRPKTDDHDIEVKMRKARQFLANGDKVKFVVHMRGRERHLSERWVEQLNAYLVALDESLEDQQLHIVQRPRGEGNQIIALVEAAS